MKSSRKTFVCPVCSGEVSPNAKGCRDCGACEEAGWRQDSVEDGLDLPDTDFDYDKFLAEEFGGGTARSPIQWIWWITALLLFVALGALLLHGVF